MNSHKHARLTPLGRVHMIEQIARRTGVDRDGGAHLRTRPYTPRTNGKAERFIQHT